MTPHKPIRFRATVRSGHKENALEVPFDPGERWQMAMDQIRPGRRGYAVRAAIDGCRFASHVVVRSGKFWLLLPALVAVAVNAKPGDEVDAWLEPGVAE